MSTKGLWLVFAIALAILLARFYFFYTQKPNLSSQTRFTGSISSEPYLKTGKLIFQVNKYLVFADYQNLTYGDKVLVQGKVDKNKIQATRVVLEKEGPIGGFFKEGRRNLNQKIVETFPSPESDLLSGMLLGIKTNLSKDFKQDLINTGTLHVVVVSGYNITLLASFFLSFSLLIGRKKASFLAIGAIFLYAALVGASPPTIRAVIMGTLTVVAMILGRQVIGVYLLLLSAYLMLLISPENLFDISFQLTFAATLGVVTLTELLSKRLVKVPKQVRETLSGTLAAQVLVIPLIFFYFGNISLLSPIVNVLVLWTVPISTILGFVWLGLTFLSQTVAQLFSYLLLLPLSFFTQVVGWFGHFDLFVIKADSGNLLFLVGYSLVLLAFLLSFLLKKYARAEKKS
ncbi:MAG TPA: ComEC/Rec2 family competence protein [Candidatus Saccharimonadales bacterium]|nr:ComEC/Rec2 family competence protein [Candidatus Saccharimonadales bacterium]